MGRPLDDGALRQVGRGAAHERDTRDIARAAQGAIADAVVTVAARCRQVSIVTSEQE